MTTYSIVTNGQHSIFTMDRGHVRWENAEQCDACGRALDESGIFRLSRRGNYPKPAGIACECGAFFPAAREAR